MRNRKAKPGLAVLNGPVRARRGRRSRLWSAAALAVFFAIGAAGTAIFLRSPGDFDLAAAGNLVDRMTTSAYTPRAENGYGPAMTPRAMPLCGSGKRVNCVVDGDTLWLDGAKIRLVNIDAPETRGRCRDETVRASKATRALSQLLHGQPIRIRAGGNDRYGRLLAAVSTPAGDVGETLVRQRLAVRWRGRQEPALTWCGA